MDCIYFSVDGELLCFPLSLFCFRFAVLEHGFLVCEFREDEERQLFADGNYGLVRSVHLKAV